MIDETNWDVCTEYMADNDLRPGDPLTDEEAGEFVEYFRDGGPPESDIQQMLADLRLIMVMDDSLEPSQVRYLKLLRILGDQASNWEQGDDRFVVHDQVGDPSIVVNDWAGIREIITDIAKEIDAEDCPYKLSLYDLKAPNWREPFAELELRVVSQVKVSLVGDQLLGDVGGSGLRLDNDDVHFRLCEPDLTFPLESGD